MRLTDISIRALKAPQRGAVIHYDDALPGFGVRVSQAGTKSFVLTYGVRRTRETIGRVGIVDLKDARQAAKRRLAALTLGKGETTRVGWNTALDEYLNYVRSRRKASTADEYERLLKRHFRFGETTLADITSRDIEHRLAKLPASEKFHAYTAVRPFMNWCYRKAYVDQNQIDRVDQPKGSKPRSRILTDDEVRRVWNATDDSTFGTVVKLLILTGQRLGEVSDISPNQIGEDTLHFPETKNGRPHTIPLGKTARTIVGLVRCTTFGKPKAALDTRSRVSGWTLHDLRRTYASKLAALGVPIPVIERLLNHVSGTFAGIVGTYQRYDYAREMREAVETYETWLQALLAPEANPRGSRASQQWETRDAVLIEEASA